MGSESDSPHLRAVVGATGPMIMSYFSNAESKKYSDDEAGIEFMVPNTWEKKLDLSNVQQAIDIMYVSTKNNTISFLFGASDIWDYLSHLRQKGRIAVPKSVQDAIPIKAIYEDGIFEVDENKYSKSYRFTDINYAVAGQEEKENMI